MYIINTYEVYCNLEIKYFDNDSLYIKVEKILVDIDDRYLSLALLKKQIELNILCNNAKIQNVVIIKIFSINRYYNEHTTTKFIYI